MSCALQYALFEVRAGLQSGLMAQVARTSVVTCRHAVSRAHPHAFPISSSPSPVGRGPSHDL